MSLLGSNLFPVIRYAIMDKSIGFMRCGNEIAGMCCIFVFSANDELQD